MSATRTGWVPNQHGAWAMLFVPLVVGLAERARDGLPAWAWPLAVTWVVGYFCFHAASLWLKAPARRRRTHLPALATYGAVSALAGAATLLLGGWPLLWWLPVYLPLMGTALWFVAHRRERALASGLCTVLAACLLAVVLPSTTPQAAWRTGWAPATWHAMALFGYFFGTVFVVKTLVRERGKASWARASVAWHLAWTLLAAALAWTVLPAAAHAWAWCAFFAVGSLRAWALPWLGPRRGRTVRPGQVGALEVVLSAVALALCLA